MDYSFHLLPLRNIHFSVDAIILYSYLVTGCFCYRWTMLKYDIEEEPCISSAFQPVKWGTSWHWPNLKAWLLLSQLLVPRGVERTSLKIISEGYATKLKYSCVP